MVYVLLVVLVFHNLFVELKMRGFERRLAELETAGRSRS